MPKVTQHQEAVWLQSPAVHPAAPPPWKGLAHSCPLHSALMAPSHSSLSAPCTGLAFSEPCSFILWLSFEHLGCARPRRRRCTLHPRSSPSEGQDSSCMSAASSQAAGSPPKLRGCFLLLLQPTPGVETSWSLLRELLLWLLPSSCGGGAGRPEAVGCGIQGLGRGSGS